MEEREQRRINRDEVEEYGGSYYDDWDKYDRNEYEYYPNEGDHKERGDNQKRQETFIKI